MKDEDEDEEYVTTCEKSDVGNKSFQCNHLDHIVEVEWQNKVYYMLDENYQWESGAITNDVFTWSSPIFNGLWMPKWMHWERVGE